DFDLAGFISELRSEALALRSGGESPPVLATPESPRAWTAPLPASAPELRPPASSAPDRSIAPSPPIRAPAPAAPIPASAPAAAASGRTPEMIAATTREAERLLQQGRLSVPVVPRYSEESLFGFSVRELSSPDPTARVRAAERLRILGERAAAPALAAALHAERDPLVLTALLDTFRTVASREGTAVGAPLPSAPAAPART